MELTMPHSVGDMLIHCGRSWLVSWMDFFLQRMTSSGAFSSDCELLAMMHRVDACLLATYQVEAKQQRPEGGNEQDVDEVAGEVPEPGAVVHGGGTARRGEGWLLGRVVEG